METAQLENPHELDEETLLELMEQHTEQETQARLARLSAFAATIVAQRKEAIEGRRMSGIETIWQEDEEYYAGIDELNRAESILKPSTPNGRVIMRDANQAGTRSTVFINITQPYVDMASARASDMLLPTDDKPFRIKPTPIPEVAKFTESEDLMPDGQAKVGDAAKAFIGEITEKATNAETQIWDWLVESRWHGEMRRVIEQSARIGTSILKGPMPVKRKMRTMSKGEDNTIHLVIQEEIKPASKWLDAWKFYPDPACGDSIHNGRYTFEKDDISARQLRDLIGTGYIDSEILEVLKEGPGKRNIETGRYDPVRDNELFEIWYYYGFAEADDLRAAGCDCRDGEVLPVHVVMVNDRIVKASMSIMDSGEFPYDVMRWTYVANSWAGLGVARQVRTAQRMVNAAGRNLMDNAGVAAGPQIIINDDAITPADGEWTITPLKLWRMSGEADVSEVKHAFMSVVIPTLQGELENIIKMALEFAERATNMPLILQGQQGASTETVGGMQILNANASTVLRRIAKIADDDVIEPHILRYYEWLMIYGDEAMKGDYTVDALGSTAFYERDAQAQMILQLIPMANDPEFRLSKDRLMEEILRSNKISPERVRMTDEEWKELQQRMQQNPPVDPRVQGAKEVAQIKVQGDIEKAKMGNESDMQELEFKRESMQSEFELKLQMQRTEQEHQERMLRMNLDLKMMELAQSQQISLDSIKASLASDTMKLKTQKELSEMSNQAKQVAEPPTEPAGRAPDGQAYQR
jgi:hypothetical protein